MTTYHPIFEHGGNRFVIGEKDWVFESEFKAKCAGYLYFETVLLGIKFTGEVLLIADNKIEHCKANVGPHEVCIFAGPLFDKVKLATASNP